MSTKIASLPATPAEARGVVRRAREKFADCMFGNPQPGQAPPGAMLAEVARDLRAARAAGLKRAELGLLDPAGKGALTWDGAVLRAVAKALEEAALG